LNRTGLGIQGNTPAGYKFGWLPEHGLSHSPDVGSNTGNWDHKRNLSIRSGLNLSRQLSISFNYSHGVSTNRRNSGIEQRTLARDYLAYGKKLNNGFPFVGWSVRFTGIEKNKYIRKYLSSVSIDHAVSGKETRSWQFEDFKGQNMPFFNLKSFINDFKDKQRNVRVNMNFSPLVGITIRTKKGIAINIRHNRTLSREEAANGGQKIFEDKAYSATANYNKRGGFNIPLPFFDDLKVQNQVNFTLNFDMNNNRTHQKTMEAVKYAETAFTSNWKTGLRITYSFSSKISGSLIWEYRESDSKHTGRRIDRDFGFDVNLAIQG